jgi:hypothetical protein
MLLCLALAALALSNDHVLPQLSRLVMHDATASVGISVRIFEQFRHWLRTQAHNQITLADPENSNLQIFNIVDICK